MSWPLLNIISRNMSVPDEDRPRMLKGRRSTRAQVADAMMRVDALMKSGQCTLIKDACLLVSGEKGVSMMTLKAKYSSRNRR